MVTESRSGKTVGHVMFCGNTRTHVLTFHLPGIELKRRAELVPWRQPNGPFDSILDKRKRSVEIGPLRVVIRWVNSEGRYCMHASGFVSNNKHRIRNPRFFTHVALTKQTVCMFLLIKGKSCFVKFLEEVIFRQFERDKYLTYTQSVHPRCLHFF